MVRQDSAERLSRILAGFGFLSGQEECGLVGFTITRETTLCRSIERSVVSCRISWCQVIKSALAEVGRDRSTVQTRSSDIAYLPEKGRLLPEVGSLFAAQEHVETIGVTCTVVTGETNHAQAKEYATDVGCDLVNKVEPVHVLIIIGVVPADAAVRNIADGVIEPRSHGLTNHVLGRDGDQITDRKSVV